jgi:heme-degrading monooxygenase HmoA
MPHTTLILAVLSRDTHLYRVPAFLEFHLLRRPERDDHVLCSSHTVWASKAALPDGRSPNIFARPS